MSMVDSAVSKPIVERVKNILVSPDAEWSVIDRERSSTASLITGYVVPLAVVNAVAAFIGRSIVGVTLTVVGVVVCASVIDALASTFGAQKNNTQAIKVAAYAPTAAWVAGILQ